MGQHLLQWLSGVGGWSYLAVFSLIFAESGLLLLLPGETLLLLAGVLCARRILSLELLIPVAAAAAVLGDASGYALGRGPGRRHFQARGRFLLLRAADGQRVASLLRSHGALAVAGARFVGVLRVAMPFMCGLLGLPPRRFFPYNLPACLAWAAAVAVAGYLAGNAWERVHAWVGRGSLLLGLFLALALLLWSQRRRRRPA